MLSTDTAERLYYEAAAPEAIFDYHCHLIPQEIAANQRFAHLTDIWLQGDHYKWRAMRANGVEEHFITGNADPYEKFLKWAETVPFLMGNPLYHWTHLELQRFFGIDEPLSGANARAVWDTAHNALRTEAWLSVYGIFKHFNVYAVGTTDDPTDNLEWHQTIAEKQETVTKVLPSFRPDPIFAIEQSGFSAYINKLGTAAGIEIHSLSDMEAALKNRLDFFDAHGCCTADHGLEYVPYERRKNPLVWEEMVADIFVKALKGTVLEPKEIELYKTFMNYFLAGEYHRRNWVMQLHLSALRNTNTAQFQTLGVSTGYDVMHDHQIVHSLARFLDILEMNGTVPKTIVYSLNPKDFYPLATLIGSFQRGVPGKMQLGSAWWFLDSRDGMEYQMKTLANVGLLSRFIGMLTDSRSFLSYTRHEYFRRILCNIIGLWVEDGEIPHDWELLTSMVKNISFTNAKQYFKSNTNTSA
ncbi:glucuronate isomerase [Pillotina sp. SPG140]